MTVVDGIFDVFLNLACILLRIFVESLLTIDSKFIWRGKRTRITQTPHHRLTDANQAYEKVFIIIKKRKLGSRKKARSVKCLHSKVRTRHPGQKQCAPVIPARGRRMHAPVIPAGGRRMQEAPRSSLYSISSQSVNYRLSKGPHLKLI